MISFINKFFIFLLLISIPMPVNAELNEYISSSHARINIMEYALEQSSEYGLSYTIGGILMAETLSCRYGPVGDVSNGFGRRSYGCMQMKVITARETLAMSSKMNFNGTREEIISNLIHDPYWAVDLAIERIKIYLDRTNGDVRQSIRSYNRGWSNRNDSIGFEYMGRILSFAGQLKQQYPQYAAVDLLYNDITYVVSSGDTLLSIVNKIHPDKSYSEKQNIMNRIFELNQHAFVNNNMNLIKAGEKLNW